MDEGNKSKESTIINNIVTGMCCAISGKMFFDPVMTVDGCTYERQMIEKWFEWNNTSPQTNEVLHSLDLIPNVAMKSMINDFLELNKLNGIELPEIYEPEIRESSINNTNNTNNLRPNNDFSLFSDDDSLEWYPIHSSRRTTQTITSQRRTTQRLSQPIHQIRPITTVVSVPMRSTRQTMASQRRSIQRLSRNISTRQLPRLNSNSTVNATVNAGMSSNQRAMTRDSVYNELCERYNGEFTARYFNENKNNLPTIIELLELNLRDAQGRTFIESILMYTNDDKITDQVINKHLRCFGQNYMYPNLGSLAHLICRFKKEKHIKKLYLNNFNFELSLPDSNTKPIHCACANGDLDSLMYLAKKGINFNVKDDENKLPLHIISQQGDITAIKCIALKTSNVYEPVNGLTVLDFIRHNQKLDSRKRAELFDYIDECHRYNQRMRR